MFYAYAVLFLIGLLIYVLYLSLIFLFLLYKELFDIYK